MKSKRLILAILCLALTAQISCGSADVQPKDTSAADSSDSSETGAETTRKTANLPEYDFGGVTFDILTAGNWDNAWTEIYDFYAEEENGEPINDAVYRRNRAIEEQYNVVINEINRMGSSVGGTGKGAQMIQTSVMAGDAAYDASQMGAYDVSTLAYNGYLMDLNSEVPYLDLSREWWDQKANDDLMMNGKMYYTTGDISTLDNDCTFCILFNKQLIEDYNMDDPYELVKNGTWTLDKFISMVSQVSVDVNGDTKYDENDKYGMCIWQDSMMGIINAAGEKFCSINNKGELELTLNSERTIDVFNKYTSLVTDRSTVYSLYHSGDNIEVMFANNQVLFYTRYLCIIKKYRDMSTDFGVLPYPKFDEAQNEYYSTVAPYGCSFICVPKVVENAEMTGIILEAMACESMYTVTPAYYDITLEGKMIRDDESSEMLDIILGNRVFDLGLFYQVGTYNERIMDLFRQNKTDFVSMYNTYEASALDKLDSINAAFAEVN